MIAEVIINTIAKELNKTFDYLIPENLSEQIKVGTRVFVPFGETKVVEGFVITIKQESKFATKEILKIEDNILSEKNIVLAKIMSKRYFCNISDSINLMLPPGDTTKNLTKRIKDKTANFVFLNKKQAEIENDIKLKKIRNEKQKRVLEFLLKNDGTHIQDLETLTDVDKRIINIIEKKGYIELREEKIERNPFSGRNVKRDSPLSLTAEQKQAYDEIKDSNYKEFLIYGVTGSRKNGNIFAINW